MIMGSSRIKSPRLSMIKSVARGSGRVRSPSLGGRSKSKSKSIENEQRLEFLGNGIENGNNKVMVVVDSSLEAKGAVEWALSHTVQSQDAIVLLYVTDPFSSISNKKGPEWNLKGNLRASEILHSMKNVCERRRPGVQVEIAIREGKEKGPMIVEEAKQQRVSLLVLGHKKQSMMWRLVKRWRHLRNRNSGGAVEYCIQNSSCMTIAVRRKAKRLGGYLITTKRHKNFWLLA